MHGRSALWQFEEEAMIAPVVEPVYDSLREAAEALDQAPVGYFALNGEGNITQINATLASWLQWDLALFFPGERNLTDIVPSHASLFFDRLGHPSENDAKPFAPFPVMLRRADGHQIAVRAVFAAERTGYSDLRVIFCADWFETDHASSQKQELICC